MPIKRYICRIMLLMALIISAVVPAYSLEPSAYATSSRLASGRWVKIKVTETGMQSLSAAFLRSQGFNDISKVNVYGYGGRVISEFLDDKQVDDLPLLPSVKTANGIIFFGHSNVRWTTGSVGTASLYTHELNPYSQESYYFISDAPVEDMDIATVDATSGVAVDEVDAVVLRQFHEQELAAPSNTGRVMLGEDFRTTTSRKFNFLLPNNVGQDVAVKVRFASKTANGNSSISLTANGKQLPVESADQMAAVTSSDQFMRLVTTVKKIAGVGNNLDLDIKYNPGGVVSLARLDYIEVEYLSRLATVGGQLYFYHTQDGTTRYRVEGCNEETLIWDVTVPERPVQLKYNREGNVATFYAEGSGYREFMVFTPPFVTRQVQGAGKVNNQDIHAMPVPDMLIIAPSLYTADAERLAQMHREDDGMVVHVLTPEVIYNEFSSGSADVSAFRKCLKMWHDRGEENGARLQHCLIYGRPTYDNRMITDVVRRAGYPRVPIWQSATGTSHNSSFSTDIFIGQLEDNVDGFNMGFEKLSIGVGRLPVKGASESTIMTDKIINYVRNPELGPWRNNVLIIADDQDGNVHLRQAESAHKYMKDNGNGADFLYDKLYLDAYPLEQTGTGPAYVIPRQKLQQAFNDGVMYINYIGHASPREWGHEGLMPWTDIISMNNRRLPILYAATCEFCRWDDDDVSGCEVMWQYPNAGIIATIATSRTVYISNNGELNNAMSSKVFERDANGRAKTLGEVFRDGINGMKYSDDNKLRYLLMGDPAMRLPSPELNVAVGTIDGSDITADNAEFPVIPARGKVTVKGSILNPDGSVASDFNGIVYPTLYDAERVVETLGNGKDGDPTMYNDHKTRLYTGRATVADGKWEATIILPEEIDNNYSPALLSLYAYANDGREANGHTEKLYVYGYNDDVEDDAEGPKITDFYINNSSFADGDVIGGSVIVFAKLSDESGIYISESGIGHALSLSIDNNKKIYDDVAQYFNNDPADPYTGNLSYLISDLEPGEHEMTLTAWDNAGNSSSASLNFKIAANRNPLINNLTTDVNPARTGVTFIIDHDRPGQTVTTGIEVFDLSGKKVWSSSGSSTADVTGEARISWNLQDGAGCRVPRGIYLYRATVQSADGRTSTMTKKLAVTAP